MKNPSFFSRNILKSFEMPIINPSRSDSHLIFGFSSTFRRDCSSLLGYLQECPAVTPSTWLLYRMIGKKMIFLCKSDGHARISAINIYYFNNFDATQGLNTIHEAFIGVHRDKRGQGLATAMRQAAYEHFKNSTLSGITTRIKKDNLASLASASKLGFSPLTCLKRHHISDDEFYLVRPL